MRLRWLAIAVGLAVAAGATVAYLTRSAGDPTLRIDTVAATPGGSVAGTPPGSASASTSVSASASASASPKASARPNGSALASRPNDGSGYWPDFSNTGYAHTPANAGGFGHAAYPGRLTDYASGMSATKPLRLSYPDNSVIYFKHFLALKVEIYGDNLTFVGCLFEGADPNDNLVQIYADRAIAFRYTTFKPSAYARPPGNDGKVSSAHNPPGTPFDKSWQLITTMKEAVSTMDHNDIWGDAGLEMVTGFAGRPSRWTNNYIHDLADTSHDVYHHDGIGPQSEGNGGPMIIDHNTIASLGNTNGLALQGDGVYDHVSFTNNYVSGWGYALSIGVRDNATNITVTGNVFSAELSQLYGFNYGGMWGGKSRGSTWRNNRLQVRAGDGNKHFTTADNGRYLWPSNSAHSGDFTG
ncbi:hypothetical protein [Hamadaea tsunoensis]|uniref:hypothetical protein n=1 Tax=Hamadaea tsunoensis TaxID=53368 RepID=UPI0004074CBB|nr:hypothetical protein [Hamadaea tsunoensis]